MTDVHNADAVRRFNVTVTLVIEAEDEQDAFDLAVREVDRQLWGWEPKVHPTVLIDGKEDE